MSTSNRGAMDLAASQSLSPIFELHIQPLMRILDREHMIRAAGLDLWDYDQVRANADLIISRLESNMPPLAYGGPWPNEWIGLFRRWRDSGFQRLMLGKVDASGYTAQRSGTEIRLEGRGTIPNADYHAWLQPLFAEAAPRSYTHYWSPPPAGPTGSPTAFHLRETFDGPPTLSTIVIIDIDGTHMVTIT